MYNELFKFLRSMFELIYSIDLKMIFFNLVTFQNSRILSILEYLNIIALIMDGWLEVQSTKLFEHF